MNFMFPGKYVNVRRHRKCLWIKHADTITSFVVHEDSIYFISWDLCCSESVKAAHQEAINALTVGTNNAVYTGSADGKIRVWTRAGGSEGGKCPRHVPVTTLGKHKSAINALALSEDGSLLFSRTYDRSILVLAGKDSVEHFVAIEALRGHHKAIMCVINIGGLLISVSTDQTGRVWRRGANDRKFSCLAAMEGHVKGVKSLGFESPRQQFFPLEFRLG